MKDEIKLWKEKTKGLFNIVEWTRFWNYITNLQEENDRLNNIINEANQCILDFFMTEEYIKVDGIAIADNYNKLMNILGTPINYDELKEGK